MSAPSFMLLSIVDMHTHLGNCIDNTDLIGRVSNIFALVPWDYFVPHLFRGTTLNEWGQR